ncbi:hypothetical protein MKX03_008157, partial [Papaver bracteatum]
VMKLKSKLDDRESMQTSTRYVVLPMEANHYDKVVDDNTSARISANNSYNISGCSSYLSGEDYYPTMSLPYFDVPHCYPSTQ